MIQEIGLYKGSVMGEMMWLGWYQRLYEVVKR